MRKPSNREQQNQFFHPRILVLLTSPSSTFTSSKKLKDIENDHENDHDIEKTIFVVLLRMSDDKSMK